MCTNRRYIYNRFIKQQVLTNCGKCDACQQEKAVKRSARIRNNIAAGQICLFVTLTYDNRFVPYIDLNDLKYGENYDIPIYRSCSGRFVRSAGYAQRFKVIEQKQVIGTIPFLRYKISDSSIWSKDRLRPLVGRPSNHVGVCFYKDAINFIKRLRQTLQRHYNYNEKFTYFSCSEYGGKTQRPHLHLLLFFPSAFESVFRNAILESWPYADINRTKRGIEVARDCAGYVSSYVNGNNCLSSILNYPESKQRHSYSHGFGLGFSDFHPEKILKKVDEGALTYNCETKVDGIASFRVLPIPKYAICRIFPKFKGYSRLSVHSLSLILRCPTELFNVRETFEIGYTYEDAYKIWVLLSNSFKRYKEYFPDHTIFDYVINYLRTWNCYNSTLMKLQHEGNTLLDYLSFYENISEYKSNDGYYGSAVKNLFADINRPEYSLCEDFNALPDVVSKTQNLSMMYQKYSKQKDMSHYIIDSIYDYG